ncbi:MAG: hypothetical protein IJC74_05145 [Clostridia bacterium]|nr:hypothetical protein [Clostridia bacterium]
MSVFMLTLPVCAEISEWAETEVLEAINRGYVPENFSDDWTKPVTKAEFAEPTVLHEAGIYYFEADLTTGECAMKEFVAVE